MDAAVADDCYESVASSPGSVSPLRPEELQADDAAVPFTPAFSKASSSGPATPPCDKDDAMPVGAHSPAECLSGLSLASDDEVPNTDAAETFSSPAKASLVTPSGSPETRPWRFAALLVLFHVFSGKCIFH